MQYAKNWLSCYISSGKNEYVCLQGWSPRYQTKFSANVVTSRAQLEKLAIRYSSAGIEPSGPDASYAMRPRWTPWGYSWL